MLVMRHKVSSHLGTFPCLPVPQVPPKKLPTHPQAIGCPSHALFLNLPSYVLKAVLF